MTRGLCQSQFYKIGKHLINKPSSFAHKEMSFLCFIDDWFWRKRSVLTLTVSTRGVILPFKDQVFPPITELGLGLCFSLRGSRKGRTQRGLLGKPHP